MVTQEAGRCDEQCSTDHVRDKVLVLVVVVVDPWSSSSILLSQIAAAGISSWRTSIAEKLPLFSLALCLHLLILI